MLTNFLLQSCGYTHTENEIRSIAISNETSKRFDQSFINNGALIKEEATNKQHVSYTEVFKEEIVLNKTKHIVKTKRKLKTKNIKNYNDLFYSYTSLKLENDFFKKIESKTSILCIDKKDFMEIIFKPELNRLYKYERNKVSIEGIRESDESKNRYAIEK